MVKAQSLGVLAITALVVAAMAAVSGCESLGLQPASRSGPMREFGEHGMVVRNVEGSRFTDGFEVLHLGGEAEATIRSVTTIGASGSLRQVGALVAGPQRRIAAINYMKGFPPREDQLGKTVEAVGAVIKPLEQTPDRMGYELLVGYEVIDDTRPAAREALEVVYEIDGVEYLWRSPAQILHCPEDMQTDECEQAVVRDG